MSDTVAASVIGALWLSFIATHMGLGVLRPRLGPRRFTVVFVVVADVLFAALVLGHGAFSRLGPWVYFHDPAYEQAFGALAVVGLTLMVAGALDYLRSAGLLAGRSRSTSLQRLTRHPFMIGIALWGIARAALASQPVDIAFFGGFPVLASIGSYHQDRKLVRLRGDGHRAYFEEHPVLPLLGMIRRRRFRDGPWLLLLVSAALGALVHLGHEWLFGFFGVPFAVAFIAGSGYFTWVGLTTDSARELNP